MAAAGSARRSGNSWLTWTFWAAGIVLLLVELNAGMDYVETGLQHNMGNLVGWLPALGMIALKAAQHAIWLWGMLAPVLRGVPLAALGLLLVTLGLAMNKQTGGARRQTSKE